MSKMEELFCDDVVSVLIEHARVCPRCRTGAKHILDTPLVSLIVPDKTKETLLQAIAQIEKENTT